MSLEMPKVKIGKCYPISYFTNFDETFEAKNGVFSFKGYQFERVGRNQLKVLCFQQEINNASNSSRRN